MQDLKVLNCKKVIFNNLYIPELIYYFNTSSDEANYMLYSGFYIYTGSQLSGIFSENTLVFASNAYTEQNAFFLSAFGYLQKSSKSFSVPGFDLEVWKVILLIFTINLHVVTLLFSTQFIIINIHARFKNYVNLLLNNTLFSFKLPKLLRVKKKNFHDNNAIFNTLLICYVTNYYLNTTLTKLSKLLAFCSDKTKFLREL